MRTARANFGCFSVTESGNISNVVAVGDGSYAEILNVEAMQWQNLPNVPFRAFYNKGVESVVGPYLGFSVGGYADCEKRIIGLRKQSDNNYLWEQVNGLSSCRHYHLAVNAPMTLVPSC